jgi:hypothetical protein
VADAGRGICVRAVFGGEGWRLAANDAFGEIIRYVAPTGLAENLQG